MPFKALKQQYFQIVFKSDTRINNRAENLDSGLSLTAAKLNHVGRSHGLPWKPSFLFAVFQFDRHELEI